MKLPKIMKDKKGQALAGLYNGIQLLILVGLLLGLGLIVLDKFWDQTDSGTEAYDAVNETIVEIGDIAGWIGIVVVALMASVVFVLIMRGFRGGGGAI